VSASLSYVLPVFNGERSLKQQVLRLLDILSDLTLSFDVLIIDDGSVDDTSNVAADLVSRFPQISLVRNSMNYGQAAAEQTGLRETNGDLIMIQEVGTTPTIKELVQLWHLRNDSGLVVAVGRPPKLEVSDKRRHLRLDQGTTGVPAGPTPVGSGLKIIRRAAIRQLGNGDLPRHHLQVKRIKV
jgi:cellulose synthase/poly-beta-1,6-N-acetylglucosamine synthase-like glycosyltransferase